MLNRFNRSDQIIFLLAVIGLGVFSYLTINESLLFEKETKIDAPLFGKVLKISNDVRHKKTKQLQWKTAKSAAPIHIGDSLFTGPDSVARVEVQGGSQIDINPNSMVYFDKNASSPSLNLEFGRIEGKLAAGKLNVKVGSQSLELNSASGGEIALTKASSGEGFDIESKSGSFQVNTPAGQETLDGGTSLKIKGAEKEVAKAAKKTLALEEVIKKKKEQERLAKEAEEKAKIVKSEFVWIKPESDSDFEIKLDANSAPIEIPKVTVEWRASPAPTSYILEFSQDPSFQNVLSRQTLQATNWTPSELGAGEYFVRVRPETILDNWSPTLSFSLSMGKPKPLPAPILVTPQISYRWPSADPVKLEWKAVPKAKKYKIEFSDKVDFTGEVKSVESVEPTWTTKPPGMGLTYFRVGAVAASGIVGAKSRVGSIQVSSERPIMNPVESKDILGESPEANPPTLDFNLSWQALGENSIYEVQVAKTADFSNAQSIKTRAPTSLLKLRSPGKYYSRVRALSEAGLPLTEYSESKDFDYKYRIPLTTPVPMEPGNNFTMFFQKADDIFFWLAWKPVRGTEKYEIEIARDAEFKDRLITTVSKDPRISMKSFGAEGNFYWRVRATSDSRISNWSKTRSMKLITARGKAPLMDNRIPATANEEKDGK